MWSDSRHYQLGDLFSCHSVSTVSIVCVETDFGSGLMGSQPNQTSAADSYPLDGSIDNLWTRIILSEILLTFFCWDSVSFLERWKRSSLSSTCFAYYLYMLWLSVTVDWCFQFCDSVVVLFFSAVCASLTQFCDEWGLIFWLPFSPSFHEWDVRPRWKFVHLGSHYLLPESTWMTATCSRWSKFSHTFLSFRLCMVILAGFSWNRFEMLSMAATCFICLSRCLFGRHWCVNRTVSPLLVFFVILFAESLRIPASRHFEKKEDSFCLIYIRFLGKMCRVDFVDKTETNPVDWRHRWHVGIFEISAFSYSIWFPWMNVITRVRLRNDISNGARWNQRQQTKAEQIQQDKSKEKERNAPTEWRWL